MYLTLQTIHHNVTSNGSSALDFFRGSEWLCVYFRALGCSIGRNVCLYPNGGDPMMTEPDLMTIGDHVCLDDAILIGHVNTKGFFALNASTLHTGATMRSFSRLLAGSTMEPESALLEHTLVLAGDVVPAGSSWQGWLPSGENSDKSAGL